MPTFSNFLQIKFYYLQHMPFELQQELINKCEIMNPKGILILTTTTCENQVLAHCSYTHTSTFLNFHRCDTNSKF